MQLVYEGNWHTYEEWGAVRIYEDDQGNFYCERCGYSVMADCRGNDCDPLELISGQQAIDLIDEWAEIELQYQDYCSN